MQYMPLCFSLENKKILLLGAGKIAKLKLEKLLNYSSKIDIISNECSSEMKELIKKNHLNFTCKDFQKSDLSGYDFVIVAINNIELQKKIYIEARKRSVLCNCVDVLECCDFIFPSVVHKGELQIAFSTNGIAPALSKSLRIMFEKLIPNEIISFLEELKRDRQKYPKGKKRQEYLINKVNLFSSKHLKI